jgi:outer membrane protein assembly factor BamD
MKRLIHILLLCSLTLTACATGKGGEQTYDSAVERAYARAERAMERGDYIDAVARYNAIRSQFPYSRFATLSDLRLGDAYYEQEKFATAISQYRTFIKLHPNHPEVDYASFQVAESFRGQMPQDWFLLPPSYERELNTTRDAEREYEFFLKKYPDSEYADDARRMLARVKRRLADHELYVATFYLQKDNPRACAMRLRYLLDNYSGVGLDSRALFLLGRSYLELGDVAKARTALQDLIDNFPDDPLAREASRYLERHSLADGG